MKVQKRPDPKALSWGRLTVMALSGLCLASSDSPALGAAEVGQEAAAQKIYASPRQAADALAVAWHNGRTADLLEILGAAGEKLVSSGDPVAEKHARDRLALLYEKRHRIEAEGESKAIIVMGDEDWPYPIPLVKQEAGWRFDVVAGAQEVVDRRVGRNELDAIQLCRTYVEAQRAFAAKDRSGNGPHEYAQKLMSSEGKHDGLYWPVAEGEEESPVGPLVAQAEAGGYGAATAEGKAPFKGYYYRILTEQGPHADGGARNYLVGGRMTGGFALVAYPSGYLSSGIMTFVVNQDGIVFQKNLGPETKTIAENMTAYDPDNSWKAVEQ